MFKKTPSFGKEKTPGNTFNERGKTSRQVNQEKIKNIQIISGVRERGR